MDKLHMLTFFLLVVGGLNWLLFALFGWEVGELVGEMNSTVAKAIYVLVGLSAVYEVVMHKKMCRQCAPTVPTA